MDVDKVKYWTELSDYDLDTAEAMFQTRRWLYVGFISEIMPLNIESRYPSYKRAIAEGLSEGKCRELIDNTKSLQTWIKGLL